MDAVTLPERAIPETVPVPAAAVVLATADWSLATRIAFRFCVAYFSLYVVFTQMLGSMTLTGWIPRLQIAWPMKDVVLGTAKSVFQIDRDLVLFSGSGDKTYDWVQAFCMLGLAAAVTAVWSVADRRRRAYPGVHKWFYVFVRFALGATMISYGVAKLIPLQMPFPTLLRLIEPYGNFSPMGVLWYSIGASRPYEMFTGSVEVLAGLLLVIPWTALPGALIALAASSQIFTLNMTYDVPVKLFSFHLILMSLFLLAPDLKRLLNVFVFNRTAPPSTRPPLARTPWLTWTLVALQLLWGAYLFGYGLSGSINGWYSRGGGAPKPPLYGIWVVDEMTLDGVVRLPLLTDTDRYHRLIVANAQSIVFERMDGSLVSQPVKVDMAGKSMQLTAGTPPGPNAQPVAIPVSTAAGRFAFEQPDPTTLVLDGDLGGRKMRLRLAQYDLNKFLLLTRGFNWVQEYPFNR